MASETVAHAAGLGQQPKSISDIPGQLLSIILCCRIEVTAQTRGLDGAFERRYCSLGWLDGRGMIRWYKTQRLCTCSWLDYRTCIIAYLSRHWVRSSVVPRNA
jgi:hypothetical protein